MSIVRKIRNRASGRLFTWRKRLLRRVTVGSPGKTDLAAFAASLNRTQRLFVRWNAARLGISEQDSLRRYHYSWQAVADGHQGARFELFMYLNQEIFSVFFGNREEELFETYRFHGYRDLLRKLVMPEPAFTVNHPVVQGLADRGEIQILDFGCGLAQRARALAEFLQTSGKRVRLALADIPSVEAEFLEWMGDNTEMEITVLPCTRETPIPELPECDVIIATEFFEHVNDPLTYFRKFDERLRTGGFLWTDVADHEEGFLHVCPQLGALRAEIAARGYKEIQRNVLFRKR